MVGGSLGLQERVVPECGRIPKHRSEKALRTASLGTSFFLCDAINCEPLHSHVTAFLGVVQQKAEV